MNLPDPSINSEEIKDQIKAEASEGHDSKYNKEKANFLHPYYSLFRDQKRPVIQYEVPGSPYKLPKDNPGKYRFFEHETQRNIICIDKGNLFFDPFNDEIPGILISINPLASDDAIQRSIKEIKSDAKKLIVNKDKSSDRVVRAGFSRFRNPHKVHMEKIGQYFGWLEVYDEIVSEYIKLNGKRESKDGILVIPEEIITKTVPNDTKKVFESDLKQRRDAYKGAVKLIKSAPNISFYSSTPRKKSQSDN